MIRRQSPIGAYSFCAEGRAGLSNWRAWTQDTRLKTHDGRQRP
jgi:hypothetical protein